MWEYMPSLIASSYYDERYMQQIKIITNAYSLHLGTVPDKFKMKGDMIIETTLNEQLIFSEKDKTESVTINNILKSIIDFKKKYYDAFWFTAINEFCLNRPLQLLSNEIIDFYKSIAKENSFLKRHLR
jgi:hypothetical protein